VYKNFETEALHGERADNAFGALAAPIFQTSTFVFDDAEQGGDRFAGKDDGFMYTRLGNPTIRYLEQKIAAMEQAEECVAFSSGMGAISGTLLTLLGSGDHIVADPVLYGCTYALMAHTFPRFGIQVDFVDCSDTRAVLAAMRPNTKAVYFETPANPSMKIIDIAELSAAARQERADCLVMVDNTFATPYLTRPLELGADIVLHSATKYLNGHGDVVAGMAAGKRGIMGNVRGVGLKDITGAVLSPHDAFLILRGLKTLKYRMDAHCRNAQEVAEYLLRNEKVEQVYYPGLSSHPGHDIAKKQMRQFGGVISFDVRGGFESAKNLINNLHICVLAVSLGDAETLIQHPASMTHSAYSKEEREAAGFTDGLVRLSVGLENPGDIIDDLEKGFSKV
jgi:methionine-gamma-lyase